MDKSKVGGNIRKYRKEKGLTQKQLGDLVGKSATQIGQYENGYRNPKLDTLEKIAYALEVSAFELLVNDNSISEKQLYTAVDIDFDNANKYLIDTFTDKGLNNLLLVKEYLLAHGYNLLEVDENDNFTFICSVKSNCPKYVLSKEELIKLESLIKNTFDLFFDIKKDGFFP